MLIFLFKGPSLLISNSNSSEKRLFSKLVSVSFGFVWLFGRHIFKIITTNLWRSDRPVSIVGVFWNNPGGFVRKRSVHDDFSESL